MAKKKDPLLTAASKRMAAGKKLTEAQRDALTKARAKSRVTFKKKMAKKESSRRDLAERVLAPVVYRGHAIIPSVRTTHTGRRVYKADVTKDNKNLWLFSGSSRAIAVRRAKKYVDDIVGQVGPRRRKGKPRKKVVKVSYATRARMLKARGKKRGTKNRAAAAAHLGAAVTTAVANPKKKGKKNRRARLGAAAKLSRARQQRPGEGFAYLVQVQDSNSKKRTRKNPEVDTGTASPARAKQIAAAFLRSV